MKGVKANRTYERMRFFMYRNKVLRLTLSAVFLALALVLPFLTGQLAQLGSMLLPMHLPVLLCGFVCGWPWGLAVGFVAPLLRFALFGMPPLFTALAMAFELAAYGAVAGLLVKRLPQTTAGLYTALIAAKLAGRVVWGLVSFVLYSLLLVGNQPFTFAMFLGGAFLNAWPGIVAQLVLVPLVVLALRRTKWPGLATAGV